MDIEKLKVVLKPVKETIKYLKKKDTSLADCFLQLIKLAISIKSLLESFC